MKVTWSAEANGHVVSRSQWRERVRILGSVGANEDGDSRSRGQQEPRGPEMVTGSPGTNGQRGQKSRGHGTNGKRAGGITGQHEPTERQNKGHAGRSSQWEARIQITRPAGTNGERKGRSRDQRKWFCSSTRPPASRTPTPLPFLETPPQ